LRVYGCNRGFLRRGFLAIQRDAPVRPQDVVIGPAAADWLIESSGFRLALGFACLWLAIGLYLTQRMRRFPAGVVVG
jgi:hypothetical protein